MLTLTTFALSFLFYEAMYRLCTLVLAHRIFKPLTPVVRTHAPSYIISTLHALFSSLRGFRHLSVLRHAPPILRLAPPLISPFSTEIDALLLTNLSLSGYLASDMLHVITHYPHLGKLDTLLHHLAFLASSLIAGRARVFPYAFSWLIVGEASTPLLNLRWLLIKQGYGDGRAISVVSTIFAAVFFATRFVIYGSGLIDLLRTYAVLGDKRGWGTGLVVAFVVVGFGLNLVWIRQILRLALRGGKKKVRVPAVPTNATQVADAVTDVVAAEIAGEEIVGKEIVCDAIGAKKMS